MSGGGPPERAAEQVEPQEQEKQERDHANRAERAALERQKSYSDDAYRPGISDRLPSSRPGEAHGDRAGVPANLAGARPRDAGSRAERSALGRRQGAPAGSEGDRAAASRDLRTSEPRRAGQEAGKALGELPPLPKETSPIVKGVGGLEAGLKVGALVAEIGEHAALGAALEGGGGLVMLGAMAHEFLEARKDWAETGGKALEMAGVQLSMKVMGGDSNFANSPHIQDGKAYTASELFKQINERLPGAWDRWALEQAGAGDKARGHMNRGLADAADEANRLLRRFRTPAERQTALGTFARTIDARIEQDMLRRADELRARRRRR